MWSWWKYHRRVIWIWRRAGLRHWKPGRKLIEGGLGVLSRVISTWRANPAFGTKVSQPRYSCHKGIWVFLIHKFLEVSEAVHVHWVNNTKIDGRNKYHLDWVVNSLARSISPFRCVFVIRTWRWRAPPFFPFFFIAGALGTTVSEAVTCKPSDKDNQLPRYCWVNKDPIPEASCFNRSTSFGTWRECHKSRNSGQSLAVVSNSNGRFIPFSTCIPPSSSVGLISFQNTILNCPSFAVRVTKTSPSFSSSSMACGASFHDSFKGRTEIPPPFRVCRCISVSSATLLRNAYSCYGIAFWVRWIC